MKVMSRKKNVVVALIIAAMAILLLAACSTADYSEDLSNAGVVETPDYSEPIYKLGNIAGENIWIYKPSDTLIYAVNPSGNYVFGPKQVNAVISKLVNKGYRIVDVRFHPLDQLNARFMFVYLANNPTTKSANDDQQSIIILGQ